MKNFNVPIFVRKKNGDNVQMCLVMLYNRRISICKFLPVLFSFTCVQFPCLLPNKRVHISFYIFTSAGQCRYVHFQKWKKIVVKHCYTGIEILTNFYLYKLKSKLVLFFSFYFITMYSWNNTFDQK